MQIDLTTARPAAIAELKQFHIACSPAQPVAPAVAIATGSVDWFFDDAPCALHHIRARRTAELVRSLDPACTADAIPPRPDPTREGLVHGYAVLAQLARTPSSVVYRARHLATHTEVALKIVPHARTSESLRREVALTLRARGDAVVRVFDFGANSEYDYLALELLRGETLAQRLAREPRIADVAGLARAIATALDGIHAAGVVHGDVKPHNIFLGDGGRVTLFDFGCAVAIGAGDERGLGTPPYIAPEQGCGNLAGRPQPLDARSDLYALGVTLYQVLTGALPITNKRLENFWRWQIEAEVPHVADAPPALAALVARSTRKRPDERFQSARELLAYL